MNKLYCIRTYYPHWSKYSGYNRLLEFFSSNTRCIEKAIGIGEDDFLRNKKLRNYFRALIKKNSQKAYKLNDFYAEIKLYFYWLFSKVNVVHYLDGEHGISFFKTWAERTPLKITPKIVVSYHQPNRILKNLVNQHTLDSIDTIIVLCKAQKEFLSQYVPSEKIEVIYHGIDTQYYHPIKREFKKNEALKCLSVGSWLRDYNTILQTAELLKDTGIEFHILNPKIETNNSLNIYSHSNISDEELLLLYQTYDVLFLPFEDATANNVILESMSCGMAIMSNDLEALKEYTGYDNPLLMAKKPALFAKKLIELDQDRVLLKNLSERSLLRAKELSWNNIAKQVEDIYQR